MKKVVIFDFDGVIADTIEHAFAWHTYIYPDNTLDIMKDCFTGNIHDHKEKLDESQKTDEEIDRWLEETHLEKYLSFAPFDGVSGVINELSKKYILIINTSSREKILKKYLKHYRLDYFDRIYDKDFSKSKKIKFENIFKDYNVDKNDCYFITDTSGDVKEAAKVKVPTIVVTYGFHDRSYFDGFEQDIIGFADKPEDILGFIK